MTAFFRKSLRFHGVLNLKTSITCNHVSHSCTAGLVLHTNSRKDNFHTCSPCSLTKKQEIAKKLKENVILSPRKQKEVIEVWHGMTIEELGNAIRHNADYVFQVMKYIKNTDGYTKPNDVLDWDIIVDVLRKVNKRLKIKKKEYRLEEDEDVYPLPPADDAKMKPRPPVVTIMGHVDHGKTTLLDYLRKSSIVQSEFGGITQHIGAFSVKVNSSNSITFLDTPGHAAFKAMRSRGAHATDIVILVVAADDGVMEQTEESIRMAKSAQVPIIVAINKIDKKDADVETTKRMVMGQNLILEEYGGDIQCVQISALKGTNINALTDAILVQAELSNLRADPEGQVEGVVIETKIDIHKGKLVTALIRRGTLKKNCFLTAGTAWAKVRTMYNEHEKQMHEAPPSTPTLIAGWKDLPNPGDIIIEVESERKARRVAEIREAKEAKKRAEANLEEIELKRQEHSKVYKQHLLEKRQRLPKSVREKGPRPKQYDVTWTGPILSIVIKADVDGSLEALHDSLCTYCDPRCKLDIVHSEVGSVSIGDVEVASLFNAIIYNFNVNILPDAHEEADKKGVTIRPYNVIYKFVDDIKNELNGRIPPKELERVLAEAVVHKLYLITEGKQKNIPVAGCRCTDGNLKINADYKILRDGVEIHRGKLTSMRNLKTEVTSIKKDQDCGLRFKDTSIVFQPGDMIQMYEMYTVPEEVNWIPFKATR